jgi:hypothetical protein
MIEMFTLTGAESIKSPEPVSQFGYRERIGSAIVGLRGCRPP